MLSITKSDLAMHVSGWSVYVTDYQMTYTFIKNHVVC